MFDDDMEEEIDVFDLEVSKPISPYDLAHWVPQCCTIQLIREVFLTDLSGLLSNIGVLSKVKNGPSMLSRGGDF